MLHNQEQVVRTLSIVSIDSSRTTFLATFSKTKKLLLYWIENWNFEYFDNLSEYKPNFRQDKFQSKKNYRYKDPYFRPRRAEILAPVLIRSCSKNNLGIFDDRSAKPSISVLIATQNKKKENRVFRVFEMPCFGHGRAEILQHNNFRDVVSRKRMHIGCLWDFSDSE